MKVYIEPHKMYWQEMPYSEVCMHMRIAGECMGLQWDGRYMAQLYTPGPFEWVSSSYMLTLTLTMEEARSLSHQGQCDDDVQAGLKNPKIRSQVDAWDEDKLRAELKEYGAWDEVELSDHSMNQARMLWLAAGDIVDGNAAETGIPFSAPVTLGEAGVYQDENGPYIYKEEE